jgi:hypothetical protein
MVMFCLFEEVYNCLKLCVSFIGICVIWFLIEQIIYHETNSYENNHILKGSKLTFNLTDFVCSSSIIYDWECKNVISFRFIDNISCFEKVN